MAEMLLNELKASRTNGLEEAVRQCIAAASNEQEASVQKVLLKVKLLLFIED